VAGERRFATPLSAFFRANPTSLSPRNAPSIVGSIASADTTRPCFVGSIAPRCHPHRARPHRAVAHALKPLHAAHVAHAAALAQPAFNPTPTWIWRTSPSPRGERLPARRRRWTLHSQVRSNQIAPARISADFRGFRGPWLTPLTWLTPLVAHAARGSLAPLAGRHVAAGADLAAVALVCLQVGILAQNLNVHRLQAHN